MTSKTMAAAGLALMLAAAGCSGRQGATGDGVPGKPPAAAAATPADPLAKATVYACEDGQELRALFNPAANTALARLGDGEAVSLPRDAASDVEAYTDGSHTIGVDAAGDVTYTESPEAPILCRAPSKDLPAPAAAGVSRNLTADDAGKTIEMTTGEKLSISLVGIPTAGYVWAAEKTPPFVKVSDGPSGPTISAQNQPGYAGGNHWEVLVVEAVKAGEGDLVLVMRRPWEDKAEPDARRFSVKLKVR